MSYSQNREEDVIVQLFNANTNVGHVLDIGAHNGSLFSNTLRLFELGWSGVCIEPSPCVFVDLLKLHGSNPKIALVNAAVTQTGGLVDFYDCGGDAVSTTQLAHKAKWENGYGSKFTKMIVNSVSFDSLFRKFGFSFDFINLDVEGISAELFMAMPLRSLERTRCLCIEHDSKMAEIQDHAAKFGFSYVHHNGENVILWR